NRRTPFAFDIGVGCERRHVDSKIRQQVQSDSTGGVPLITRMTSSAAKLDESEPIFRATMEFRLGDSTGNLSGNGPLLHVVSHASNILDLQSDLAFACGCRRRAVDKVSS